MNSSIPIDIHCSKLVEWLVQHRHCKKNWGECLATIRKKIRAALKDMPENEEIRQLLIGSKLDYFKSKQIVELLKETEASSKNIFGFYSSQRMKDWQDIVNLYERECVYLAEIATDLIRETNYEVPGSRKLLTRLRRELDDAEKEKVNLQRRAQQLNSDYQKLAQSYEIPGSNIEQELYDKTKSMSAIMNDAVKLIEPLSEPLDYYQTCVKLVSKKEYTGVSNLLHHIIRKGNTTFYEYKNGEAPDRVESVTKTESSGGLSDPSEIELVDDEIDFGDDLPSSESSNGFIHVSNPDNGNSSVDDSYIKVEDSHLVCDTIDKVARGDDAKLLLEHRKTRNQILNNLYELEAFFQQKLSDTSTGDHKNVSFLSDAGSTVSSYDEKKLDQSAQQARVIIGMLERNKVIFQIMDSPIFVENIKDKFSNKLKQASECSIKADLLDEKIGALVSQIKEAEAHASKCVSIAKELKSKVECSMQDIYRGRPINIMGCVS